MAGTKSRTVAVIFTIFMILISIIYGPIRSLSKLSDRAINEVFGKSENTISKIVEKKAGEASNLRSVALRQMEKDDNSVSEIEKAYNSIVSTNEQEDLFSLIKINERLDRAIDDLVLKIGSNSNFTKADKDETYRITKIIESTNNMLDYNQYTQKINAYNKAISSFPANIYARVFGFRELPQI